MSLTASALTRIGTLFFFALFPSTRISIGCLLMLASLPTNLIHRFLELREAHLLSYGFHGFRCFGAPPRYYV
jgi:hypothetical protein